MIDIDCPKCIEHKINPTKASTIEAELGLSSYSHGISLACTDLYGIRVSVVLFPHHGISCFGYESPQIEMMVFDTAKENRKVYHQRWLKADIEYAKRVQERYARWLNRAGRKAATP